MTPTAVTDRRYLQCFCVVVAIPLSSLAGSVRSRGAARLSRAVSCLDCVLTQDLSSLFNRGPEPSPCRGAFTRLPCFVPAPHNIVMPKTNVNRKSITLPYIFPDTDAIQAKTPEFQPCGL
jgi:hypothetical protein